nr:uracil-DNA glycosylase family protein [Lichenibacterium minor]
MSEMPFVDFYARMVAGHHGAQPDSYPGSVPRGFFTAGQPGAIRLMLVLLNPGQPAPHEAAVFKDATGAQLARIVWEMSGQHLNGGHPSPTLRTMRRDIAQLFGRPLDQCGGLFMFTNLVRVTTAGNSVPDAKVVRIGADWLREEIALWRPEKVLAYGKEVAFGMLSHGVRVDALLPHPAAVGNWLIPGRREAQVAEIRKYLGFA